MIKGRKAGDSISLDTYASTRVDGMILWTIVVILIFTRCNTLKMSPQRGNIIKSVLLSRFSSLNNPAFKAHLYEQILQGSKGRLVYCGTAMSHFLRG